MSRYHTVRETAEALTVSKSTVTRMLDSPECELAGGQTFGSGSRRFVDWLSYEPLRKMVIESERREETA